jgi:hypothetical protein
MRRERNKPFDAAVAIEHTKRTATTSKTVPIPAGMSLEQYADVVGQNSMAWLQVFQALHFLEQNPLVMPSKAAMEFVQIAKQLASSASLADTAEEAFRPLDELLPNGQIGARKRAAAKVSAAVPRKLWPADEADIRCIYEARVRAGETYGAIKALAAQYNVSRPTITKIVKSGKKNSK